MPMSCQASARSASLPIGSNTAIARRASSRRASGSGGARMKATRARSISARSSVGSSPWRLAVLDRLGERRVGGVERSGAAERPAEVGEQRSAFRRARPRGARQARSRSDAAVANSPRSSARRPARPSRRPPSQRDGAGLGVDPTELRASEVRLLEVVADDLLVPGRAARRRCASSQAASRAWRSARSSFGIEAYATSRISTWLKRKPSSPSKSERSGRSELLARRGRGGCRPARRRRRGARSSATRAAVEQPAFDRSALEHRPLVRLEPVDAGREQRLDRRRHGVVCGVGIVGEHREHLLDEQRVALGRVDDAIAERRSDGRRRSSSPSISSSDSSCARAARARRASCRGRGAAQDGRASKRSGRARQRSRIGAPLEKPSDVLEQVEQRRLGPVDVVHDDDEGSRRRRASRRAGGTPRRSPPASPARRSRRSRRRSAAPRSAPRSTSARSSSSAGSGSAPATSRTISASGRYVMPSPYATQRPTTTRASRSNEPTTSRARRDLPIPGGPTIVASRHDASRDRGRRTRARSSSSSRRAADERA